MVRWSEIDSVLLDMDGTLLDKYFDDYFWEELIPEKFAEQNKMSTEEARRQLAAAYRAQERTLNWTDVHYWSHRLGLDIVRLKEGICSRVQVHPGVEPFLEFLRREKKEIALVTNAHPKTVQIKLNQTNLAPYLDTILCSNDIGLPKEEIHFWRSAEGVLQFDKERTLFIDDNEDVLLAAQTFGIKHLFFKSYASSRVPPRASDHFPALVDFRDLIPNKA